MVGKIQTDKGTLAVEYVKSISTKQINHNRYSTDNRYFPQ